MEEKIPPLMYLELINYDSAGSRYLVTDGETSPGQLIIFNHNDYSIEFAGSPWMYNGYLDANRKWLRSILFTALRADNKNNFKIPFTFPAVRSEKVNPESFINVYSDGSCRENGNGGWGSVILKPDGEIIELSGSEKGSTSNRMELMAAYKAVETGADMLHACGKEGIRLFTDSLYVIKGISHRLEVWTANRFITARGTPVANKDLWSRISEIQRKTVIFCEWVESGGGSIHHNRCDTLAGEQSGKSRL